MNDRPSIKELSGKLRRARELLAAGDYLPVDPSKIIADFRSLKLFSEEEQFNALSRALGEVGEKNYRGKHPPEKSFETVTYEEDLFVFIWESGHLQKKMYLKFCLPMADGRETVLYLHSFHESKPRARRSR